MGSRLAICRNGGRHIGRDCYLFLAAGMDGFGWFNCTSHAVLFSVEDYLYDYLEISRTLWNYIKDKMIDKRPGGEWHSQLDDNDQPADFKPVVDPWKCPYHNGRMCLEIISRM